VLHKAVKIFSNKKALSAKNKQAFSFLGFNSIWDIDL